MSTVRGSAGRTRPQKHQNRTAFRNDLHDTSERTKQINSLQVSGVCARCRDKIQWKIKYKKYKPLSAPRKCVRCGHKTVKHAYHAMCAPCARALRACAKCCSTEDEIVSAPSQNTPAEDAELQAIIKSLPERKRRTLLRFIRKQSEKQQSDAGESQDQAKEGSEDLLAKKIESLKLSIKNKENLDEFDFGSEGDSDSDDDDDDDDQNAVALSE